MAADSGAMINQHALPSAGVAGQYCSLSSIKRPSRKRPRRVAGTLGPSDFERRRAARDIRNQLLTLITFLNSG
jgi:hypothetical protein